jgi:SPP1 gp7 family putative phage head morphogenesis protein
MNHGMTLRVTARQVRRRVPPWRYPRRLEAELVNYYTALVAEWYQHTADYLRPRLAVLAVEARRGQGLDAWPEEVDAMTRALRLHYAGRTEEVRTRALNIGQRTFKWNDEQWRVILKRVLGVQPFQTEPWLTAQLQGFVTSNVRLIQKLGDDFAGDLGRRLNEGLSGGVRAETLSKELLGDGRLDKGAFKTVEARARLIARDQVGKANGQLTRLRQQNAGLNTYTWRDVDDSRVRTAHSVMDGRVCRWDDPTVYWNGEAWVARGGIGGVSKHPGADFQCRCFGEPRFEELIEQDSIRTTGEKR